MKKSFFVFFVFFSVFWRVFEKWSKKACSDRWFFWKKSEISVFFLWNPKTLLNGRSRMVRNQFFSVFCKTLFSPKNTKTRFFAKVGNEAMKKWKNTFFHFLPQKPPKNKGLHSFCLFNIFSIGVILVCKHMWKACFLSILIWVSWERLKKLCFLGFVVPMQAGQNSLQNTLKNTLFWPFFGKTRVLLPSQFSRTRPFFDKKTPFFEASLVEYTERQFF